MRKRGIVVAGCIPPVMLEFWIVAFRLHKDTSYYELSRAFSSDTKE
jgi:hypothetical protein